MKIAVTTPTGHVGSAAADFLLDFGGNVQVRLLGRRPEKLTDFIRRGAESVPRLFVEEPEFLTADKTGFSQIIESKIVLGPLILSASCFICG